MQLFLNATSPFARVAHVIALEKGLQDHLTLVWSDPWNNDPALLTAHPQLRIPVLITDDGHAISESLLIAQYLDRIGQGMHLVPVQQMGAVLARASVAYGLMEAAFNVVIARKYAVDTADASVMGQRRLAAMARALQHLETSPPAPQQQHMTLDQVMAAVALEYLCFRLPTLWPTDCTPGLYAWLAEMRQRPSLQSTRFA